MNPSSNILAKNYDFKKLRHNCIDGRVMTATTLMSWCHRKTLVPFCLQKKRPEKAFLKLTVYYRKIAQKNLKKKNYVIQSSTKLAN